jgi:hypothetical protein
VPTFVARRTAVVLVVVVGPAAHLERADHGAGGGDVLCALHGEAALRGGDRQQFERLFAELKAAPATSPLPVSLPDEVAEALHDFLVRVRLSADR